MFNLLNSYTINYKIETFIFVIAKIYNPVYILVLTAGMYSIVANSTILVGLLKSKSYKLTGGSIAHIGIAMMLIGIMFSEGYSKAISINTLLISNEWSEEDNQTNIPLFLNEPKHDQTLFQFLRTFCQFEGGHQVSQNDL